MTDAQVQGTKVVQVELDVPAHMRDGVVLRADIFRPAGDGPWPTLLVRTPYNKRSAAENVWNGFSPTEVASAGFIMVIQDVRGRYASDGTWEPLRHEGRDGADTIAWAAKLPGSNGRVGMLGGSYCGHTQWRAAIEQPPALKAITPLMTWAEPCEALVARGGATQMTVIASWSLAAGLDWLGRQGRTAEETATRVAALIEDIENLEEAYWDLPVDELPVLRRHGTPMFVEPAKANDVDATQHMRVTGSHVRVDIPSLHTGGWFDSCLQGTIDNFTTMRDLGRESRLIIGPWTHEDFGDRIGAQDFGIKAARDAGTHPSGSWSDEVLAFLRSHLTDDAPVSPSAPVRIFVMGRNQWRDEATWPTLAVGSGASEIGLRGGLWAGIAGGSGICLAGWLILGLVSRLAVPLEPTETISPGHLLTIERHTALTRAALSGLAAGSAATAVALGSIDGLYGLVTIDPVNAVFLFLINAVDIAVA